MSGRDVLIGCPACHPLRRILFAQPDAQRRACVSLWIFAAALRSEEQCEVVRYSSRSWDASRKKTRTDDPILVSRSTGSVFSKQHRNPRLLTATELTGCRRLQHQLADSRIRKRTYGCDGSRDGRRSLYAHTKVPSGSLDKADLQWSDDFIAFR
jgi:hypothetical protein